MLCRAVEAYTIGGATMRTIVVLVPTARFHPHRYLQSVAGSVLNICVIRMVQRHKVIHTLEIRAVTTNISKDTQPRPQQLFMEMPRLHTWKFAITDS